jgi:hypothetical protein
MMTRSQSRTPKTSLRPSQAFEQKIHRIHELLERFEAEVTWNDYVVDPDQPTRRRQIDVTIRRGEHLTLVECRLHESRQDVKWIEELIGRRESLRANAVIAVSSSGFTSGAIAKAKNHGIITRDLRELADDEVRNWGRSVALTLYFFAYSDIRLTITFEAASLPALQMEQLKPELAKHPALVSIFNAAAKLVGERLIPAVEHRDLTVTFGARLELDGFRVCGESVIDVEIQGKAKLIAKNVEAPTVSAYRCPSDSETSDVTIVEQFPLGETSIVHDGDRISTHIDLSKVEIPPLHQFRYVWVRSPRDVEHEVFSLGGIEKLYVGNGKIDVVVAGLESR